MLIDTHAHLNADAFNDDLEDVLKRAKDAGVSNIVVVGFNRPTIEKAMELVNTYDHIYGCIGWHPVDAIDCAIKIWHGLKS